MNLISTLVRLAIATVFFVAIAIADAAETNAAKVFNVREFGAKGDGKTFDTEAIQKALDDCGKSGGGTVLLPPGTYLSKPLTIGTKTTLLIEKDATLMASTNQNDFLKVPGDWLKAKSGGVFDPFISRKGLGKFILAGCGTD